MKRLLLGFFLTILSLSLFFYFYFHLSLPKPSPNTPNAQLLESPFTDSILYQEAFSSNPKQSKQNILAGIISHHLLAKNLIANFFQKINPQNIENIILIGPDHFDYLSTHKTLAVSSLISWQTPFGQLNPEESIITSLVNDNLISLNDTAFRTEHSIYTLIPFIKYSFPQAKIIPIILNNRQSIESFNSLGQKISQHINMDNTILIVSSDFSHNVSEIIATQNDQHSTQLLQNLNQSNIDKINCDCHACLAFLIGYLNQSKYSFQLIDNQNSNDYSDQPQDKVTSYISGYFLKPKPQDQNINLLFTGDLSFDRYIRQIGQEKGFDYILKNLTEFFYQFDSVIINLESPITNHQSISIYSVIGTPKNFVFTSPPLTAEILAKNNINIVNLGNNHILNFGQDGLNQTLNYLKSANISYFGNINNLIKPSYLIKNINNLKIGFVNYNQFSTDNYQATIRDIDQIKSQVDILILIAHWGNEYTKTANETIQKLAHQFIDQGVDLIIGSHPHVIQQTEIYKNKFIYYSLGNFVFDQYFSQDTQKGLLVEVNIDLQKHTITIQEHRLYLQPNGQTILDN
ncbi:MAG: AmmeMemoRadiSam system protein B [Candidatus Beckwithbacteria bacterium]